MISLEEVRAVILARIEILPEEEVSLAEALGRTLSQSVSSTDPIPPFDNTAMDGFALRAVDVARATPDSPVELEVTAVIEAGREEEKAIVEGTAMRIFTGAMLPDGADAIIPFERCDGFDEKTVAITFPVKKGAHIRRKGEDVGADSEVLAAGTRLGPASIGLLASVGLARVPVRKRPRVAVHSSGDELVPVDAPLAPGKIRNSNLYSLCARIEEWGAEPLSRPVLADDLDRIRTGLRQTLALRPDAIVTTGGISAGDFDYIRDIAQELGEDVEVRKVNMKPGKPLVDGTIAGVPFFGLPGNPAACLVSFEIFVRPALAKMEGRKDGELPRRSAEVTGEIPLGDNPRLQYLRGRVEFDDDGIYRLSPVGEQGSHLLSSFADANCLIEVPPHRGNLSEGERVEVLILGVGGP